MVSIYYLKKDDPGLSSERLASNLSGEIKAQANKFRFEDDRIRFLVGRLLIQKKYPYKDLQELKQNAYGKLYFDDNSYFNISHSGDYVVMVMSKAQVGIDIEKIDRFSQTLSHTIFSKTELNILDKSLNQSEIFYDIWTRKEAVLKCCGIGISERINEIDTSQDKLIFNNDVYYIKKVSLDPHYKCHIACKQQIEHISITRYTCSDLN